MRLGRAAPFVLLVCLVFDFVHPWAPGVFFFEGDQLFVDGAVRLGTPKLPKPAPDHAPAPALPLDAAGRAAAQTWSSGADTRRSTPPPERRYASRSSDRSSAPSSSPDAH